MSARRKPIPDSVFGLVVPGPVVETTEEQSRSFTVTISGAAYRKLLERAQMRSMATCKRVGVVAIARELLEQSTSSEPGGRK